MTTILVLDDDELMVRSITRMLTSRGYRVLACNSAEQARAQFAVPDGSIDLLLADVNLRGDSGPAIARELRRSHPRLAIVFMSGQSRIALVEDGIVTRESRILDKPFTAALLGTTIVDALAECGACALATTP